jgi:hypothetical protein
MLAREKSREEEILKIQKTKGIMAEKEQANRMYKKRRWESEERRREGNAIKQVRASYMLKRTYI